MTRLGGRRTPGAAAVAVAGVLALFHWGCKDTTQPAPDIALEIEGHWGSEPAPNGTWTPFVVHGSPVVGLVGAAGGPELPRHDDLQLAAWWAAGDGGDTAPHWIGGYPACPVDACPATIEPTSGWLSFMLDTTTAVPEPPATIRVTVVAWRGDRPDVNKSLVKALSDGIDPTGAELPANVTLRSSPVIVATKNWRFRDASEAVLACKAALKERAEDTEDRCQQAIQQHREDGQSRNLMLALERLAYFTRRQGRLEESRELFEEVARTAATVEGQLPSDQTRALRMASLVTEEAGDYTAALELAQQALDIDGRHGHMLWEVRDRSRIGSLANKQGRPTEAIGELRQALTGARLLASDYDENNALLTLAEVYEGTGRYSRALACMEDARPAEPYSAEASRHLADTWAIYLTNAGWFQLQARRRGLVEIPADGVRANLTQALTIVTDLGYELDQANGHMNLAELAIQEGDSPAARDHLLRARPILAANGSFEYSSHALALEGELALLDGDAAQALRIFDELAAVEGRWSASWWADFGRARALTALGRREQAIGAYETALGHLEGAAALLDPLIDRPYFTGDRDEVYDRYLLLLLDERRHADAFAVSERCRDRTALARRGIAGDEQQEHQELLAVVADVKRRLDLHEGDEAFLRPAGRDAWEQRRGSLLEELVEAQAALATALRLPPVAATIALEEVQDNVPEGAAVLYYHVTADELILFVVRRESFQVHRTTVTRHQLATWIGELHRDLDAGESPSGDAGLVGAVLPPSMRLDEGERVLIVPHGPLHALPFAVLGRGGQRLVEGHAIGYAPGAGVLGAYRAAPLELSSVSAIVVADPTGDLAGAREEGHAVAARVPGARVLLGGEATDGAIREGLASAGLFHFAGHAVVDADLPQHSHLRLAGGQKLSWLDLQTIRVEPALVILSGCETGRSMTPAAGEAWGLSTAFLHGGASSVVAAGWQVPDGPTRALMDRLYDGLLTTSAADSLRRAQLELAAGEAGLEASLPSVWGAFAHHGAPW